MKIHKNKVAQMLHKHDQKKVERFKKNVERLEKQKILEKQKVEIYVMTKYRLKKPIQSQRRLFIDKVYINI